MKLKIFISALLVLAFTPSVFSQNQMSVGNNIGNISYYMTEWTFTDVARMSDNWLTRSVGGSEWDSGKGAEVPTDANGYPLSIPFAAADGSQQVVHTIMPCYTMGEYTLVMKGKGSIYFRTPSGTVIHHYLTPTGGTFVQKFTISTDVTPQNTGNIYPIFLLDINQSDVSDPIRDIKLIAPGFYDAATQSETEVFHPLFKQRLTHFSLLRYMDFGYTNGSPLKNFSERTLPTTYTQMGAKGAAAEYMADLANEIRKEHKISITPQYIIYTDEHAFSDNEVETAPRIDFKFSQWYQEEEIDYFAEAKNLSEKGWYKKNGTYVSSSYYYKRYIETGIHHLVTPYYPSHCVLIAYVLNGHKNAILTNLNRLITSDYGTYGIITKPEMEVYEEHYISENSLGENKVVLKHLFLQLA